MANNLQQNANLISSPIIMSNIKISEVFMTNEKKKLSKKGKLFLKKNIFKLPKKVSKLLRTSKIVFNPYTNRSITKASFSKKATQKRLSNKYYNGEAIYNWNGVILPKGSANFTSTSTINLAYTIYTLVINPAIEDATQLIDTMFFFLSQKLGYNKEYRIAIKVLGEGALGMNFFGSKHFKWTTYQKPERFISWGERAIQKLDNSMRVSPDAGEEEDEPNTYIEAYPIKKIQFAVSAEEFFGGCLKGKSYSKQIINNVLVQDYASTGNNCLFVVIKKFLHNKCLKSNEIRNQLGLEKGTLVSSDIIEQLSILCKVNIQLFKFNLDGKLELFKETINNDDWRTCMVLCADEHYSHIINKEYSNRKIKCKICLKKIIESNMGKHKCNDGVITYVNRYKMKDRMGKSRMKAYQDYFDVSKVNVKSLKEEGNYKVHNLVYDFETFAEAGNGNEVVYSAGIYYVEEDLYKEFYGENSLKEFMDWIKYKNEGKESEDGEVVKEGVGFNLISYNGAGFDHYFIYHYCLDEDIPFHNTPLMNGSRILQLTWAKNRTFDLFLFTCPNSLDACLEGFKVDEISKGVFPHCFPRSWEDVYYKGKGLDRKYYPKKMLKKIDDPNIEWAIIPKYFDFKNECLTYLKSDVMGLYEVYEKMRVELLNITGSDMRCYLTISQMSYDFNCSLMNIKSFCELPQKKDIYDIINLSIYGGRTKPVKLRFENKVLLKKFMDCKGDSKKLKKLIKKVQDKNKEVNTLIRNNPERYDEVVKKYKNWEHITPYDVKSLYPTTYDMPFPVGMGTYYSGKEYWEKRSEFMTNFNRTEYKRLYVDKNDKLQSQVCNYGWGVYVVDIQFIPKHIVPLLPQKNEKGMTVWDLIPRNSQHYTTIDLEEAEAKGYIFTIKECYIWKMASCVLKPFVDKVYSIKKEQDVFKTSDDAEIRAMYNPAKRMTIKIILNSLYGKMIQRPILEASEIIDSFDKNKKFHKEYDWTGFDIIGEDKVLLSGIKREFEGSCRKPIQVGSFILSYSRKIMREYNDKLDPFRFTDMEESMKRSFYYTDTDCFWISSFQQHTLEDDIGEELGDVEDELEGGICPDAYFVCPKVYMAKYWIYNKYDNKTSCKTKMRAKGHPSYCLKPEYYKFLWEQGSIQTDEFVMLKKIRWKLNTKEINAGLTSISIRKLDCRRKLNRDTWVGRIKLVNGDTYPKGFFSIEELDNITQFGEVIEKEEDNLLEEDSGFLLGELTDTPI